MSTQLRYRAFICYSQRDRRFALRLHRALERYRVPADVCPSPDYKRRLGRFFRDDDELAASSDLGNALRDAIKNSESLIVVCSPKAAQSRWVNEEVILFKRTGRADRIFAVLVDGTPNSADSETECFPPALLRELNDDGSISDRPTEPLGLDTRKESFARICTRLVAGLLRLPFDDFWKREVRARRRRIVGRSLAAIGFSLPVVWFSVFVITTGYPLGTALSVPIERSRYLLGLSDIPVPEMVDIRPGQPPFPDSFMMGSPENEENRMKWEGPQHRVVIRNAFRIGRFEVTFEEYDAYVKKTGVREPYDSDWGRGRRPVVDVTWEEAQAYISWLSAVTGKSYRLPTEAEWEYAARAGSSTAFWWGEELIAGMAVCFRCGSEWKDQDKGSATAQVDDPQFVPNGFGLYHTVGNVWEWVEDCGGHEIYNDARRPENGSAWIAGGNCGARVRRGGAWGTPPFNVRSASRGTTYAGVRMNILGFRLAQDLQ